MQPSSDYSSSHAFIQAENTKGHTPKATNPPPHPLKPTRKKREKRRHVASCSFNVFCDASNCSVTVLRPHSTQTQQQGLNRGEHACAFAYVRAPCCACYDGALVLGTGEQPCTLPEPCGEEFNMDVKAGEAQPSWARTHDYLMAAARASFHPRAGHRE